LDNFLDGRKPEIDYPCLWTYRIIGWDEPRIRAAVMELVGELEHKLVLARESSTGKYRTLQLEITVRDEEHRHTLFARIAKHPDVRFVI
jgi:putative lipoic acid-binding regulatory protein